VKLLYKKAVGTLNLSNISEENLKEIAARAVKAALSEIKYRAHKKGVVMVFTQKDEHQPLISDVSDSSTFMLSKFGDEILMYVRTLDRRDINIIALEVEYNSRKYIVTNADLIYLGKDEATNIEKRWLHVIDIETGITYYAPIKGIITRLPTKLEIPMEVFLYYNWDRFKDALKEYIRSKLPKEMYEKLEHLIDESFSERDPRKRLSTTHFIGMYILNENIVEDMESLIKEYISKENMITAQVNYVILANLMLDSSYPPDEVMKLLEKQATAVKEENGKKYYLFLLDSELNKEPYVITYDQETGRFKHVAYTYADFMYRGKSRVGDLIKAFKETDIEAFTNYLDIIGYLDPSKLTNDVFELVSNPKVVVPGIMLCKHKDTVLVVVLNDRFEHAILYRNGDVVITRAYNILNRTIDYIMRNPTIYISNYEAELIDTVMSNLLRYDEFPNELAEKLTELYIEAKLS